MATEHERIEKNTADIAAIDRKLDEVNLILKEMGTTRIPISGGAQYAISFGGTQQSFAVLHENWEDCAGCDNMYENKTGATKTVTIQVWAGSGALAIDCEGENTVVPANKTRAITFDVPAGKSIHAGGVGKFNPDVTLS